jgi:hypothetical protein
MKVLHQLLGLLVAISPIILLMLLFSWLRRSATKYQPREDASALEFFVAPGMRILIRLVLALLVAFTLLTLALAFSKGEGWFGIVIPLSVLVAIILAQPRPVTIDHHGIRQNRWIRRHREIAWSEIAWMRRGLSTGVTYVKSKNGGRPISFSPLLVGQSRFEREVRAHARQCSDSDNE